MTRHLYKISLLLGAYLICTGLHAEALASPLPYSPTLSEGDIREVVAEDLKSEVRDALLDHPEMLAGVPVDNLKIIAIPTISYDDAEGYVLSAGEVRILVPETGTESKSAPSINLQALQNHVEATLREGEASRLWQDDESSAQPAKLTVRVEWFRPTSKVAVTPFRKFSAWLAGLSAFLLLSTLALELSRRARMRRVASRLAASRVRVSEPATQITMPVQDKMEMALTIEKNEPSLELPPELQAPRMTSRMAVAKEPLPPGSADALQALAELPLDEAIGVLTRFDQSERQSIIEHLPLHPALKQRLRKGLTI